MDFRGFRSAAVMDTQASSTGPDIYRYPDLIQDVHADDGRVIDEIGIAIIGKRLPLAA